MKRKIHKLRQTLAWCLLSATLLFGRGYPVVAASSGGGDIVALGTSSNTVYEEELSTESDASPSSAKLVWESGCATGEELKSQIEEGREEIILTGDIVLEPEDDVFIFANEATTVNMNGYRIIIAAGARLGVQGEVHFDGDINGAALFESRGYLRFCSGVEITASGEGAVAVSILGHGVLDMSDRDDVWIRVSGSGSIALNYQPAPGSSGECKLNMYYIQAEGVDSVGVASSVPVYLYMSRIEAEGEAVVCDEAITAEVSLLRPLPAHTDVIVKKFYLTDRKAQHGVSVVVGAEQQEILDKLTNFFQYGIFDDNGNLLSGAASVNGQWEDIPEDLSAPGSYTAVFKPLLWSDWEEWMSAFLLPMADVLVPIHVVAPDQPHIQEIFRMEETIVFRYLSPIVEPESMKLLYSDDEGRYWQDVAEIAGGDGSVSEYLAVLEGLPINADYLFKLAVVGGPMEGESMAVPFYYYENDADRKGHGDRDGDDRQEQELPDPIPPLRSPPASDNDNRESTVKDSGTDTGTLLLPEEDQLIQQTAAYPLVSAGGEEESPVSPEARAMAESLSPKKEPEKAALGIGSDTVMKESKPAADEKNSSPDQPGDAWPAKALLAGGGMMILLILLNCYYKFRRGGR